SVQFELVEEGCVGSDEPIIDARHAHGIDIARRECLERRCGRYSNSREQQGKVPARRVMCAAVQQGHAYLLTRAHPPLIKYIAAKAAQSPGQRSAPARASCL